MSSGFEEEDGRHFDSGKTALGCFLYIIQLEGTVEYLITAALGSFR